MSLPSSRRRGGLARWGAAAGRRLRVAGAASADGWAARGRRLGGWEGRGRRRPGGWEAAVPRLLGAGCSTAGSSAGRRLGSVGPAAGRRLGAGRGEGLGWEGRRRRQGRRRRRGEGKGVGHLDATDSGTSATRLRSGKKWSGESAEELHGSSGCCRCLACSASGTERCLTSAEKTETVPTFTVYWQDGA
uniref:Uncharacterized protein n=1 Tax=Oryza nivara TaxID=4536 RepID=A0A0E0HBT8_ORYNI